METGSTEGREESGAVANAAVTPGSMGEPG